MRILLASAVSLTVAEWFAFFYLSQVAFILFPPAIGSLLFFLGFAGRFLGSMVLGYFGDRFGTRASLVITVLTLVSSSLVVSLVPSTPLVAVFRVIQGFSLGGEWGGASVALSEAFSSSRFRVFLLSFIQLAVPIALILSTGAVLFLSSRHFEDWNYALLLVVLLSLLSIPLIKAPSRGGREGYNLASALKEWKGILHAVGIKVSESANFYIFTSFVFSFATASVSSDVLISVLTQLVTMPLFGYLANQVGRKEVGLIGIALFVVGAALLESRLLLPGELVLSLSDSALYSPQSSILVDLFKGEYKHTNVNLSYQLASVLGGSLPPLVLSFTGYPIVYVVLPYALITALSFLKVKG
ncbi:MAG: MFS transporter [Candidatus Aramenus sulfurataquae]|uniref:MFS transporter n=2 Tax=Candidatus Aramenus sulfurataquae TaxID=1326980 RepID=A0AAE3K2D3_9CREN|nr:MFS transporter [Candidatus Aramenus sulfurataquae]